MEQRRDQFYQLLDQYISTITESKRQKYVITQATYDSIISALSLPKGTKCPQGSYFKFWCNSNFQTQTIGKYKIV